MIHMCHVRFPYLSHSQSRKTSFMQPWWCHWDHIISGLWGHFHTGCSWCHIILSLLRLFPNLGMERSRGVHHCIQEIQLRRNFSLQIRNVPFLRAHKSWEFEEIWSSMAIYVPCMFCSSQTSCNCGFQKNKNIYPASKNPWLMQPREWNVL